MTATRFFKTVVTAVLLATYCGAAPASSPASSGAASAPLSSSASAVSQTASSVVPSVVFSTASRPVSSASTASGTSSAASATETVPYASDDPNYVLWNETSEGNPQPIRGSLGATILGPQDTSMDQQNPDLLAPPSTDAGTV